jgi:SMC interacting uncharacterized protein involved in chromosome segregation
VNIDQLEYQLSREHRRSEEEMNALKKQNSDLSLQVTQARYEADEFYKTGLERNIDAVALGNQVRSPLLRRVVFAKPRIKGMNLHLLLSSPH